LAEPLVMLPTSLLTCEATPPICFFSIEIALAASLIACAPGQVAQLRRIDANSNAPDLAKHHIPRKPEPKP